MKKILLIIALTLCIFQMVVLATAIDIGSPAIDRASDGFPGMTIVDKLNPSNGTGTITSIEIFAHEAMSNIEVATFYIVSGNYLSTRDYESISDVTIGYSQHTVSLDVEENDLIGIYIATGRIDFTTGAAGSSVYYGADGIPSTNRSFSSHTAVISLYGTGATVEVGIKWNGVTITKWNGITITKINGK